MLSFSFAYDQREDRICLRLGDGDEMVWITRRLARFLLTQAAERFAESAGSGISGYAQAKAPVEMEHELAVTEPDQGQEGSPVRITPGKFEDTEKANATLCERITLTSHAHGVEVRLVTGDAVRTLGLSRAGFHRLLRALWLVANRVRWDLPEVPPWLRKSYLPAGLQGVVDRALHAAEQDPDESDTDPSPRDDNGSSPAPN